MATIRPATMDDIPQIVEMAKRFYPESPYPHIYGDVPEEQAAGLVIVAMQGMAEYGIVPGAMLVAEHGDRLIGMLCLHIDPATFNPAVIAAELVWWMDPEYRGGMAGIRLVKAGEETAPERGATVMNMGVLATSPAEAQTLLERLGYKPSHTILSKRLDPR